MKIPVTSLEKGVCRLFEAAGMTQADARIVCHCLLEAELAGVSTHGIAMVPAHLKKCKQGYDLSAKLKIIKSTAAFTVCDAHNAIGMLSAWKCVELAVRKAEESGMHLVLCNNANTFSAAYCYAQYAVEHGKIAIVACNSPAQMAPLGGKEKLLGTNPLAIAIPAGQEEPFILDMATSAVAKSRINEALRNGVDKIPFGWATDMDGNPTDDPKEAVKGLILPMAGPKGYGLAMAIDILAGLLAHAACLDGVGRFYSEDNRCMNVGHVFMVIDPAAIYGPGFYEDMDAYLRRIRTSQSVSQAPVLVPGDINANTRRRLLAEGIELTDKVVGELNGLLAQIGQPELEEM
ncbi:MAG: Ldh family oxidoreductase [Oscillospiraceae bacterium]|nr:Ldh family oxidoreductase [Oscillospiraceae bacterium]